MDNNLCEYCGGACICLDCEGTGECECQGDDEDCVFCYGGNYCLNCDGSGDCLECGGAGEWQ